MMEKLGLRRLAPKSDLQPFTNGLTDSSRPILNCNGPVYHDVLQNLKPELFTKRNNPFTCALCDVTFSQAGDFEKHLQIHSEGNVCGAALSDQFENSTSVQFVNVLVRYNCDLCDASFSQAELLMDHKQFHFVMKRPSKRKRYECELCGAKLSSSVKLRTHKRIHSGEKPYKCELCGAAFLTSCQLKSHKRVHSGEKPYKCEECGCSFPQKAYLNIHKRIHSGEQPYKCEFCDTSFSHLGNLKRHIKRAHTGDKPC